MEREVVEKEIKSSRNSNKKNISKQRKGERNAESGQLKESKIRNLSKENKERLQL